MISIRNIVKQYAQQRALDNVSMEIETGKIFGLLGPNGAGKTSLIRIINQITAPDSGEVYFDGVKLNPSHVERIGYLPEERGLYKKMEIGEQVLYLARLKGLSRADAVSRIKTWFARLEMENWWDKKVEDLSKGMQQKVQFVATVLHEPELLILDEPFTGFDPVNTAQITTELLALNKKGSTIIFSTHRMETVETLCDSIALINQGHKILDGKVKEIRNRFRSGTYLLEYEGSLGTLGASVPFTLLSEHDKDGDRSIKFRTREGGNLNDILQYLLPLVGVVRLEEVIPGMNEIFIETVSKTN